MLKKILILTLFVFQFSYAAIDYNQLKADKDYCYKILTSQCFLKLTNKYALLPREQSNILYFGYAEALLAEKNYSKAKEAYKTVLLREKNNKQVISSSKKRLEEINNLIKKMAVANNHDTGNYFDKTGTKYLWQKPYDIKVYIASDTGKESVFKRAFSIWSDKLYKLIGFSYVNNAKDANIIIKFVETLDKNRAGTTEYIKFSNDYPVANKKYMEQVNIEIAMHKPSGGAYTDTNLLSITLHEIAHGLGINYHSDNINDILYYSTESYKNNSVSHRDINTIKQLYR